MTARRSLSALPTPAALVDIEIAERNIQRMADRATKLGVRLRPHVKTHKCVEAARLQASAGTQAITVSTLAEARFFASAGFRDITYAVPLAPGRADEAAQLAARVDRLHVLIDHPDALQPVERAARSHGRRLSVFLKVDCGYHRAGVDPESDGALQLAARIASSAHVEFQGVLTHAGHSYACRNPDEIRAVAAQERDVTAGFARRLRAAGIQVLDVSVGSTPTMSVADHLEGVTEMRPGNYVFYDAFQSLIGSCALADTALTVIATVVGRYPERSAFVIDAGALALSKDPGARQVDPDTGYGIVQSLDRAVTWHHARIHALSQEHGHVRVDGGLPTGTFRIGDKVRIIPNHSCLTAALFDRYYAIADSAVEAEWTPVRGW